MKSAVNEAKYAVVGKIKACTSKLNERYWSYRSVPKAHSHGRQIWLPLENSWEYLDNELANDDRDAKKMKKAEKEAQWKIAESRTPKAMKVTGKHNRKLITVT